MMILRTKMIEKTRLQTMTQLLSCNNVCTEKKKIKKKKINK